MAKLHFHDVNKIYPNNVQAVFDFNLDIDDKEFVVFVGPSGCGKSTTLRMVAGLEEISSGEIYIDDVLINDVPAKNRNIAMVFQNYALYPHMTVFENMAFSLQLRKDLFPVYEITDTEGFNAELDKINAEFALKEDEGVAELKLRKANKDEVKDFVYRNKLAKQFAIAQAREKFQTRVMTYDHEKVEELEKRLDSYLSEAERNDLEERLNELRKEYDIEKTKLKEKLDALGDSEEISKKRDRLNKKLVDLQDHYEGRISKLEKRLENSINDQEKAEIEAEIETVTNTLDKTAFEYRRYTKQEIEAKVVGVAETIGLEQYLKRKPGALSGGQRQRVALGRAIVRNPKVFLMDEPLSNLDAKLRVQMRTEISKIYQNLGVTVIYVTHDQTEAMTMATKIVCMKDGRIQQIGSPKELFNKPNNLFVAGFIGSPAMNFIEGTFDGKSFIFSEGQTKIDLDKQNINLLKDYVGKEVILGVRPENIVFPGDKTRTNLSNAFPLTCDLSELLGHELIIYSYTGSLRLVIKTTAVDEMKNGDVKDYVIDLDRVHFFDKDTTNRIG